MQTNKLITVLLLALSLKSFAQLEKVKGDGLVSISLDSLPIIEFYETKESIAPIRMVKVYYDEKIKSFNIENFDEISNEWFKPIHIHLDYYIFYLQCSQIKDNWYEVIVNEENNVKYWIKKSSDFNYIEWKDFIVEVVGVAPINPDNNPILKSPQNGSEKTEKQPIDCLIPVSINGEWLKVRVEPAICDMTNEMEENEIFDGYIRWKTEDKLIVKYYLLL